MVQDDDSSMPTPGDGGSLDAVSPDLLATTPGLEASPLLSASPPDEALPDTPSLGPTTPGLSRNPSFSGSSHDNWDAFPPLDRLTVLDILDNFALPQQLEKLQRGLSAQTEKVRRSRDAFKTRTQGARERVVEEWKRRLPDADEQLERYKTRMRRRVDKLAGRWNDTKVITLREKISFIFGVMNLFISGYLIGGYPQHFHLWYTSQLLVFMPARLYTYHKRGYHYFLADLCYFTNFLVMLSLWVFPSSKKIFTAAYCLAFGNNAVAIILWRNSLVFHSFDKVVSLFIHIMPCATLHCIVHLIDADEQKARFPAIWHIRNPESGSYTSYTSSLAMVLWSSLPYAFWQMAYYLLITVRRREKIAAGRPTSFTWLRRSYAKSWIGRIVLALPDALQEPAYMVIQYLYACLTMLPCPLWLKYRWASTAFMVVVFTWSIYNGSTYYIDVFGKRFQKELEAMKAEVSKWQSLAETDIDAQSPTMGPQSDDIHNDAGASHEMAVGASATTLNQERQAAAAAATAVDESHPRVNGNSVPSIDSASIPMLDEEVKGTSTSIEAQGTQTLEERKAGKTGIGST
ncbi:Protein of unknown function (DUF2838) [Geosmithia morbida]|uniref:Glycerophosphocholine acyltransferase 1 n=1 Tax=Geosmithia morbida TaxID=1094350 RepID=A0A9P4YTZ8_9HYPO|nr:Protein of unknown function (DUF2838) [Geosmithia morbida]KAF4121777.1 Protein of unknown function (DUF2838) [Geosmithia morbida]